MPAEVDAEGEREREEGLRGRRASVENVGSLSGFFTHDVEAGTAAAAAARGDGSTLTVTLAVHLGRVLPRERGRGNISQCHLQLGDC